MTPHIPGLAVRSQRRRTPHLGSLRGLLHKRTHSASTRSSTSSHALGRRNIGKTAIHKHHAAGIGTPKHHHQQNEKNQSSQRENQDHPPRKTTKVVVMVRVGAGRRGRFPAFGAHRSRGNRICFRHVRITKIFSFREGYLFG